MKVTATEIPDVLLIEPAIHGDERGWFIESWQRERYREAGIDADFVQDNQSFSARGTLRGLHIQHPHGQGKLVQVIQGAVFDVAVDVRRGSPHFGRWTGAHLTADNKHQLWVPAGFLHGFLVLSETALFSYKCTDLYHPEAELSVRWDDPDIGIDWPLDGPPTLSAKDRAAACLKDLPDERLPD
jgi:dTDP-4-dehydrorhamnose 3,5-epimerase